MAILQWIRNLFSAPEILSPEAFTEVYLSELKQIHPELSPETVEALHVRIDGEEDARKPQEVFLGNAYELYQQSPKHLKEILIQFIDSFFQERKDFNAATDLQYVIPVIKHMEWVQHAEKMIQEKNEVGEAARFYYEALNEELAMVYAKDSPESVEYLNSDIIDKIDLTKEALRTTACENLHQLLGETIKILSGDGVYMLQADGNYESSLLLLDKLWNESYMEVAGEYVIAIPTRDVLLVTGSQNQDQVMKLREMARKAFEEGVYTLTPSLFIREDNALKLYLR